MYVKGTNAFFLERSSMSSLPFAIDDPPKTGKSGGVTSATWLSTSSTDAKQLI